MLNAGTATPRHMEKVMRCIISSEVVAAAAPIDAETKRLVQAKKPKPLRPSWGGKTKHKHQKMSCIPILYRQKPLSAPWRRNIRHLNTGRRQKEEESINPRKRSARPGNALTVAKQETGPPPLRRRTAKGSRRWAPSRLHAMHRSC